MKDEKKAPKLRFKGFTDDWEQCKLGDVFVERNQKTVADENYPLCSFIAHKGVVPKAKYDRSFLVKNDDKKYKRTELNDFIYSSNNLETGSIGLNKFGNATISPVYSVFMVNGNSEFIAGLATTHRFIYEMIRFRQGVVYGQWRIHESDFLKIKYYIPQVLEQEEIGNLLSELDRTITLHEEKKRQLERLKSALLQKMFADKSRYPAVRFEGFSDEWKIFTLSSLATMHARIGWQNLRTSEFLSHGKYMLITGTDFKNGQINFSTCHYVEKERYEQDKHIQIKNGSILITKDGTLGKVAYVQGLSKPATLNAGIFNIEIRNENEIDRTYLFQYLKAPFLMNYVQERATGGTIKHLNQSILKSFPVQVPNKIEQNKIGELITKLDHLINLQRTKLNDIAALKNSLLQSMFI